jgi:tRNA nucleotidyltransferase (CCA-adding enzyme)
MLDELPRERVWEEWKKLLLKAPKPSVGFELMREWGITERYFPELHVLIDCPQDPTWHPEGDVWVHTMLSVDAMALMVRSEEIVDSKEQVARSREERGKLRLLFAILCHDLGKPLTTTIEFEDESVLEWQPSSQHSTLNAQRFKKIRAIGHEKAGLEPTRSLLYRLTHEHSFIESILPLVEHHLKPSQFYAQGAKAGAIRRLATKVNIEELVLVAKADFLGRTTPEAQQGTYEAGEWLLQRAEALAVQREPLKPLIGGRDLIALGLQPSPRFKEILDDVYEKQLDGKLDSKEEAIAYVKAAVCNL